MPDHVPGISPASSTSARQAKIQQLRAERTAARQARQVEANKESMQSAGEHVLFSPMRMLRDAESLERRMRRFGEKAEKGEQEEDSDTAKIDSVSKSAEEYENRNPEMNKRALFGLRRYILPSDTPEEILDKVLAAYPDHYLADEALEFLIRNADPESKLQKNLEAARDLLNQRFGRQVRAGRNISETAREFAKQGLGTASSLRDLYRNITDAPRDTITLFNELSEEFSFDKMKTVIQFVLHSIGKDLKSKGPSIEPGLLRNLFEEARSMQAILGVFRFFYSRMRLIAGLFKKEDLSLPAKINFESLARVFVKYLQERYPSPEKVLMLAEIFGLSDELAAQIIIFTQFRDAIRGVSPRLFKSNTHRQDLLMALIEAISDLDDRLEEEEEEEEEEDEMPTQKGWSMEDKVE